MRHPNFRSLLGTLLPVAVALVAGGARADAIFTGPTSPYYLDNYANGTIYVVQGTSVTNSFAVTGSDTPYSEGRLSVTTTINTTGFGSFFGLGPDGQYTLGGAPTDASYMAQATPGNGFEQTYDGTSDGTSNYTVQYVTDSTTSVVQTDLNWQNPVALFAVTAGFVGIAYDPLNNSLWLGGWAFPLMADYSLSGGLLSSFTTDSQVTALGFDAADGTLWYSSGQTSTLEQWSTDGVLLQSGSPDGLPGVAFLSGDFGPLAVAEPTSLALLGGGLFGMNAVRRRRNRV